MAAWGALLLLLGALLQAAAQPAAPGGPGGRSWSPSLLQPQPPPALAEPLPCCCHLPCAAQRWKLSPAQPPAAQQSQPPAAAAGPAAAPSAPSPAAAAASAGGGQLLINELMTSNKQTLKDEDGASPDWVELYNRGPGAVSLAVRGGGSGRGRLAGCQRWHVGRRTACGLLSR